MSFGSISAIHTIGLVRRRGDPEIDELCGFTPMRHLRRRQHDDVARLYVAMYDAFGMSSGQGPSDLLEEIQGGLQRQGASLQLLAQRLTLAISHRDVRSEEHTSELQSRENLVCR